MTNPFAGAFGPTPPPQRPSPSNPFAGAFGEDTGEPLETAKLRVATEQARATSPDKTAEALTLARRTGLPAGVVERNLDRVREMAGDRTFDPGQFVREFPVTAVWLTDPTNAAVAKDDYEGLGNVERLLGRNTFLDRFVTAFGQIGQAPSRQTEQPFRRPAERDVTRGVIGIQAEKGAAILARAPIGAQMWFSDNPQLLADAQALDNLLEQETPDAGVIGKVFGGTAQVLPSIGASAAGGAVGAVVGGALGTFGGPAGTAVGAKVGGALGAYATSFILEGGNMMADFSLMRDESGRPMNRDIARAASVGGGLTAGALDAVSLVPMLKPLGELGQAALNRGLSNALRQATTRTALINGVKAWGTAVGTEVVTETAQQGVNLLAEHYARRAANIETGADFAAIDGARVQEELLATAVETFYSTLLIGGFSGGTQTLADFQNMAQAQASQDALAELVGVVEPLKLRERSAEKLEEVVGQQLAQNGGQDFVGIEGVLLQEALDGAGVQLAQFAQVIGVSEQTLTEAIAFGQDVRIPTPKLLARLVGTDLYPVLAPNLKVGPTGMTLTQLQEMTKTFDADVKVVEQEMARIVEAGADDPAQRIVDDLTARITAAGLPKSAQYTPQNIEAMAKTAAAFYSVVAKRQGRDAFEVYRERNYRILGPQDAAEVLRLRREMQKAEKKGDLVAAGELRRQFAQLMGGTSARDVRAEARLRAQQVVEDATDAKGNLRRKLSDVTTDALAVTYIQLRDAAANARGEATGITTNPAWLTAQETGGIEDADAVVFEGFTGIRESFGEEGAYKALSRIVKEREATAERAEKGMARIEKEMTKRGVADIDAYAQERDLVGDASFDFGGETAFEQAPALSREAVDAFYADEAHSLLARGYGNAREIADEMLVPVRDVERWLSKPRPEIAPEELRRTMLLLAFRPDAILEQAEVPQDVADELVITHNLSPEKLRHALRMGGLPVPSLAVAKAGQPVEGYGDITLIGPREMADPKGRFRTRAFGADIYSPRYPQVEFDIDKRVANKIRDILGAFGTPDELRYIPNDLDSLIANKVFQRYAADKAGVAVEEVRWHGLRDIAVEMLRELDTPERIFRGYTPMGRRRYVPHTLENVVKILRKELRGGENFNYGVGSLRAKFTPQFRSIKGIKDAKDLLVSREDFEKVRDEVNAELEGIAEALRPFSPYPTDTYRYMDEIVATLEDVGKMGMNRGLESARFENVSADVKARIGRYLTRLRNLPTQYFEVKVLREVGVEEFVAALVPAGAPQDVVNALRERGLEVREYPAGAGRGEAMQEMARQMGAQILLQGEGAAPNAFIIPGVSQQTIGLMNTANLSSLMHELSHDWLRILQADALRADASEQTKADWATIVKHLGIPESGELTVEAQEKWARDFERYLATAQPPSLTLVPAFSRFRSWMKRVYKRVRAMLMPINPEVSAVFDRMLATDDEIALMARKTGEALTEEEAKRLGMTDAQLAGYRKAVLYRDEESSIKLFKAVAEDDAKENTKQYQELAAEVEREIRAEVEALPQYRIERFLRDAIGPDGVVQVPAVKLNRETFDATYGPETWKSLPKGIFSTAENKAFTKREGEGLVGTDADSVALMFGVRDGQAVVELLRGLEPMDAVIDRRVREVMQREYPDLELYSQALADEAERIAHLENTDDVLVRELTLIGKAAGIRPPNVPAIKAVAKQMVGQMAVKDIRPVAFQNAEATAARKSGEAMKTGDLATAAFHKRQQLLNHILYREAKNAMAMADRALAFARRMEGGTAQARLGKAGQTYQDAMNAVLDAYEFRNVSRPQMEAAEALRAQVAAWAEQVKAAYTVESEDGPVPLMEPQVSPEVLNAPKNYRQLSADRVRELYDTMKQIYHTASGLDKELRQQNAMRFEERVELLVETASKHWTPDAPGFVQSQSLMDKLAENVDAKHGEMIKVEMLARLLDGDQPNGPWQQALTDYAAQSQAAFNRDMEAFTTRYKAAMDRIPKARINGFFKQLVEVPGVAGPGTENPRITGQQVFHLLLNYGNESSRNAVNAGEYLNGYRPYTDANVRKLVALLTPEEMQAAQDVWDAVSMFWEQMAELNREMTGITPRKVPASQIVLQAADGSDVTLKGGYFPLKYDTRFSAKAYQQELTRAEQTAEGLTPFLGSARTTTEQGHLIERQQANGRIVDLSPEVVARHMSAAVYDLTHRRMVYDVQKIVLDKRIADIVQRTAGVGAYRKALLPWARRLAGEKGPPQTWVAKAALRARAGASTMGLGFRATTIMLQYLGVGQVAALLGPRYTARGFREIAKYRKGAFEAADALSSEVAFRQLSFNRDLSELARNMKAKGTWNAVYETAFAGIAFMDRQVSIAAFWGGYYQWLDANPTDVAGAVRAGEQAIRLSQGANSAKDLAALMASNDPLTRTLTSFFSNGSVLYQLFWRANRQLKGKGKQAKAAFLTSMLAAWIVPAVLEPLMRGSEPDEDKDLEDQIAWWFWQIASYPMQALPLARDIARMWEPGKPKVFREFAPPFLRPFSELGYSGIALAEVMGEDEVEAEDIELWIKTLGYWSNLPLDAPWGMSERLYQWMTGEVSPDNPLQGSRFVLTNAPIR